MVSSSKCLKVVHICQQDDPATGGAVRVAVEYVKRLPSYEVEAHCLFLYGQPGYFGNELGDRAHYLGITNSREFFKFGRLVSFIHKFQPDVIHHHDGLLWCHLLTFSHPSIIKIAHAHLGATNKTLLLTRGSFAERVQRQSTDILICITEDTRNSQIQQGGYLPNQTHVLYNGVDTHLFYPSTHTERTIARKQFGLPNDVFVVGFVGRLHCEMKGTDDFLKVISLLPSNFWALVVGSGSDGEQLKHLAATLRISERVVFTGILEKTVKAYHALDVFCLTSHYEPFGLVIAEAMACQVPVVGFACMGGVNELLSPDTGYIIPNRDLQVMAQAIIETIKHPETWHLRHQNAQSLLRQNHDWEKNTSTLAQLYKKTCSNL
ncbi:MAG: glycosyltransferase family 4 protein [Nostoc sp.]|uniref:glycosyltransferase family 4 protein n=1 Tax=Nostoc sp. TaxID=1180 RepID=UPI002FF5AAD4